MEFRDFSWPYIHLSHLTHHEREDITSLIQDFSDLFQDVPKQTDLVQHDVEVKNPTPVKQYLYHINLQKVEIIHQEVDYMLNHGIIEPSQSSWSSLCVLVAKPDGSVWFCTNYHKVNSVTKTNFDPIPRMDGCIDGISKATYITKLDLLKGYWCIPLTKRTNEVSAFVTPPWLISVSSHAFW